MEVQQKCWPLLVYFSLIVAPLAKKRTAAEEENYGQLAPGVPRPVKRRSSPICDLSAIFETVTNNLIAVPTAWPFCHPVSPHSFPDYSNVIKNPMWYEMIRDKCRSFSYRNRNEFVADIDLVKTNCISYNGEFTMLSENVQQLCEFVYGVLNSQAEEIANLEKEILA